MSPKCADAAADRCDMSNAVAPRAGHTRRIGVPLPMSDPCVEVDEPAAAVSAAAPPKRPPLALVLAAFLAVYLIWGSTYLGITIAVKTIPPFLMAGIRFMIAGSLMYVVMRRLGCPRPTRPQLVSCVIIGALLILGGNGLVSWAQGRVASGVTALIIASVPLWIMLVDWLRPGGRRPIPMVLLGLATGAAGVTLIILGRDAHGHRATDPLGAAVLLFASLCWAVGSIYSRHSPKPASSLMAVSLQMFAGGVLQTLTGLLSGEAARFHPSQISAASAWAFVYLTLIGSLVGYTAYVWLLQVSTPAKVSTYAYVNPFVAVILGHLVLKESLPHSVVVAGALILASVVLISRPTRGS